MIRLVNFVAFYLGWFACVAGAGKGYFYLGPLVVVGLVALHLRLVADPRRELRLLLTAAALGYTVDTAQTIVGVIRFGVASPVWWLPPLWLLGLWFIFGTTLNVSFRWLAGRAGLAALLGAISGPLSYYAGVRLGAAEFPHPLFSFVALAAVWAVLMPVLVRLAEQSRGTEAGTTSTAPVASPHEHLESAV